MDEGGQKKLDENDTNPPVEGKVLSSEREALHYFAELPCSLNTLCPNDGTTIHIRLHELLAGVTECLAVRLGGNPHKGKNCGNRRDRSKMLHKEGGKEIKWSVG